MSERKFSLYDIEQFIREAGAEKVTEDAVLDLERELEKLAESIANKAKRYAEHAGRHRIIRRSDILLTAPESTTAHKRVLDRRQKPIRSINKGVISVRH
ncbi:MAG: NFYB/HAP3 family transcription factor subunit [Candidatus Marsarchaeota archaeon]|nr:NFYB/HAP3 family transcription factor subunit [Candidatus Marsarchaeota archaeon]